MFQGYISLNIPPPGILTRVSKDLDIQQMLREKSTAINTDGRSITRNALIQAISEHSTSELRSFRKTVTDGTGAGKTWRRSSMLQARGILNEVIPF